MTILIVRAAARHGWKVTVEMHSQLQPHATAQSTAPVPARVRDAQA